MSNEPPRAAKPQARQDKRLIYGALPNNPTTKSGPDRHPYPDNVRLMFSKFLNMILDVLQELVIQPKLSTGSPDPDLDIMPRTLATAPVASVRQRATNQMC